MIESDFKRVIDGLDDLLEDEKKALLSGDLDHVARQLQQKEALIEELSQMEESEGHLLEQLSVKVRRNQALLDSALEGIRNVAKRLAALRRVRNSLDTYDDKGARQTIDMSDEKTVEKRA